MIKLVFVLRRRPELSREDFQAYWRDKHAPLVASLGTALGVRRYVQTHTVDTPLNEMLQASRGGPAEYDGIAELWWDSLDELAAAASSPEGLQAGAQLLEDEAKFIDLANSPLWLAEEHQIV
ncbi:MAG TPA: EthD domain-containing protein [Acidimicrobiales bacterium]|nr:EthD domain-containing protein [Acidimicrobiales bacterium]